MAQFYGEFSLQGGDTPQPAFLPLTIEILRDFMHQNCGSCSNIIIYTYSVYIYTIYYKYYYNSHNFGT